MLSKHTVCVCVGGGGVGKRKAGLWELRGGIEDGDGGRGEQVVERAFTVCGHVVALRILLM